MVSTNRYIPPIPTKNRGNHCIIPIISSDKKRGGVKKENKKACIMYRCFFLTFNSLTCNEIYICLYRQMQPRLHQSMISLSILYAMTKTLSSPRSPRVIRVSESRYVTSNSPLPLLVCGLSASGNWGMSNAGN